MQHGTPREYVTDIVENVRAALNQTDYPVSDLVRALEKALQVLDPFWAPDFDEPGLFGPDYGKDE